MYGCTIAEAGVVLRWARVWVFSDGLVDIDVEVAAVLHDTEDGTWWGKGIC